MKCTYHELPPEPFPRPVSVDKEPFAGSLAVYFGKIPGGTEPCEQPPWFKIFFKTLKNLFHRDHK